MVFGRKKKEEQAQQLLATGAKARAHLQSVQDTGMTLNDNPRVLLNFELEPLDGSPRFQGQKKSTVSRVQIPQPGEVWPAWYDANDQSVFMVGQPDHSDPQAAQVLQEFGISNPMAPQTAAAAPPPAPAPAPAAPGAGGGAEDRIAALERLSKLHQDGVLSDEEFATEKQKILDQG